MMVGWGMIASIVGIVWTRFIPVKNAERTLNSGIMVATILMMLGALGICYFFGHACSEGPGHVQMGQFAPFWAITSGLCTGLLIAGVMLYYSDSAFSPVRQLAKSAQRGPAVVVMGGLNLGLYSTCLPVAGVAVASLVGYYVAGTYGIAMGAMGMLSTLGITLAVDSYGPVVDNAGGIAEMTNQGGEVRKVTDELDAVGNTTAAIGKGFAIGSAAFAALAIVTAYMASINHFVDEGIVIRLDLSDPNLMAGLLIGGMIPFFFCAMLGHAVSRITNQVVDEVRRQFREIKGLMEHKVLPESNKCVDIASKGALSSIALPGLLAVFIPIAVGILLKPQGLAGLLVGALVSGLPLAIMMVNAGAAYDNAKKYVEDDHFGGKGTETHKATVVGDTIGDPLKDTMGPSINILIKLMSITALVLAPFFAQML
jgi:K(+)-stimulated pyrophosphate-energized sodium pump